MYAERITIVFRAIFTLYLLAYARYMEGISVQVVQNMYQLTLSKL